jgi:hypothetical protein
MYRNDVSKFERGFVRSVCFRMLHAVRFSKQPACQLRCLSAAASAASANNCAPPAI